MTILHDLVGCTSKVWLIEDNSYLPCTQELEWDGLFMNSIIPDF